MRQILGLASLGLAVSLACQAQTGCAPGSLADAAKSVIAVRQQLHADSVPEFDPNVPPPIAQKLLQLKSALSEAADTAFACATPAVTAEEMQQTLAEALHANLAGAAETVLVTRNKRDLGAYGSDLAVQVFPLFNSPKYFEVDFRYGVECGDDNLLLIYEARSGQWQQVMRWGASAYNTVADAYGDFVLLTPLSGFPGQRNWRFVVAHGQPGCSGSSGRSRFDLDLLEPSADPAAPQVIWHLERPYLRSQIPRLSTTEDTLSFELSPPERAANRRSRSTSASAATFRYHVSKDNRVEPLGAAPDAATPPSQAQSASTSSPR